MKGQTWYSDNSTLKHEGIVRSTYRLVIAASFSPSWSSQQLCDRFDGTCSKSWVFHQRARIDYRPLRRCHLQISKLACSVSLPSFSSCRGTLWLCYFQRSAVIVTLSVNGLGYHWMASAFVPVTVCLHCLSPHLHCHHLRTFFVVLVSMITSQLCKFIHMTGSNRRAWLFAFLKLFVEVRPAVGASSLSPESLEESMSP